MTERFIVGIVGAPFGLKGFVKVKPLSGEIDHLLKLASVTLRQGEKEFSFAIEESAALDKGRAHDTGRSPDTGQAAPVVTMRFAGFHTPEAAKALQGAQLIVDRKSAAPLQPGEFYIEDLKGLEVLDTGGHIIGHINTIIEGGGGDLVEIMLQNGELKLVPFRKEFFSGIDPKKNQIILLNLWILE